MKIDPLSAQRLSPLRRGKRGESGAGEAFAAELEGEAAAPASVGAGSAATPVEALLALQEVPDALVGQGRAKRHGEALLDQLEQLRLGLLLGRIPRARLERLAELAAIQLERVEDPRLAEILAEIELRAAVELAKLER
jgi:hypothetical protein